MKVGVLECLSINPIVTKYYNLRLRKMSQTMRRQFPADRQTFMIGGRVVRNMLQKFNYGFHTVPQKDGGPPDPRVKYMRFDDSVSVTTVFTSHPSSHLHTGRKRTFLMEQSLFKSAHHDPNKLITGIESEYYEEQVRVGAVAEYIKFLGLDLEMVLAHRASVLHTNLTVWKKNVGNVDEAWLSLQKW